MNACIKNYPDHPRSRGVYGHDDPRGADGRGSSPLARGLRAARSERARPAGIIPARAGFTAGRLPPTGTYRDHPRSRGVYSHFELGGDRREIIPARAGFTQGRTGRGRRAANHPRSRGVYPGRPGWTPRRRKSSPLARGLRPASPVRAAEAANHPRSRGVYRPTDPSEAFRSKSSPLARGLRGAQGQKGRQLEIIPARAGFT